MGVTMGTKNNVPHPVIIFVRGLPGSGKSYLTSQLQKAFVDEPIVLDPDAIDFTSSDYEQHVKKLTNEGVNPALFAYRFLRGQAYDGIADRRVIVWNQPFTNLEIFNKMITNLRLQADQHSVELPILVVEVEIDLKIAKERIENRKKAGGHGPSDSMFDKFTRDFSSFSEEGYRTIVVQGDDDVRDSVQKIYDELQIMESTT
jgi:deoxyadenosine/deoxycytidine kinase